MTDGDRLREQTRDERWFAAHLARSQRAECAENTTHYQSNILT